MLEQIQNGMVEVLTSVVLALIALGGAYATYYIKKATEKLRVEMTKLEDDRQKELLDRALTRMEEVAEKTVNKIEQTTAKSIRQAVKDGQTDKKELEDLAVDAYEEILKTLEPDYRKVIEASMGDARTYILNTIEEKVRDVKLKG
jgi:vacuolar-type H+-ATPase subunit H